MTTVAADQLIREALASFRAGRLVEAETRTQQILAVQRKHGDALSMMGLIAYERGRFDEAESWHRKAIAADRREPTFHCNLAVSFIARGRVQEAMACYERALKLRADHPDAVAGKADVLERRGRFDRALAFLAPFVSSPRCAPKIALIHARLLLAQGEHAAAAQFLETHLVRPDALDRDRRSMSFLLGRARDKLGDHDAAFEAFSVANRLDTRPYDHGVTEMKVRTIIDTYDPAKWADRPRSSSTSELPVFIVGLPRSGSTLIEQIIHAHPEAHGAGEIHDFTDVMREMSSLTASKKPYPQCLDELTTDVLDRLASAYLESLQRYRVRGGTKRISNKSLENHDRLGLIALMLPNARIIHAKRHPLDLCLSCYIQDLPPPLHPYASDLRTLGLYYRKYAELMAFWRDELEIPMLDIEYEDLVANQEAVSRRLVEFLGLDWDDACLSFQNAKRDVATISYDQVRQPIYRTAVARYERYGEHLAPLREALGDALDDA